MVDVYAVEWEALLESLVNIANRLALRFVLVTELIASHAKLRHGARHTSFVRVAAQSL